MSGSEVTAIAVWGDTAARRNDGGFGGAAIGERFVAFRPGRLAK